MRLIIIESPYAGAIEINLAYLRECISDSLSRGEAPFASHGFYPGALDDNNPTDRDLGIRAGYAWWKAAKLIAFYTDLGWSPGMERALKRAKTMKIDWEERKISS